MRAHAMTAAGGAAYTQTRGTHLPDCRVRTSAMFAHKEAFVWLTDELTLPFEFSSSAIIKVT